MRPKIDDLAAIVAVATERSFTRAAAKLGVTPSALSHTVRAVEERLGIRLLTRTTRTVTPTEAGQRFLRSLAPLFEQIQAELSALTAMRDRPAGTVRITADEYACRSLLWPRLNAVLPHYPEINVEIATEYDLTDIVAERYDAGVRPGNILGKGMASVPIGPPMRMAVVATPAVLAACGVPRQPQDLTGMPCINLRLPTYGGIYVWEFEMRGRKLKIRVDGQLVFGSVYPILQAALDGMGLACLPEALVSTHVEAGELVPLLSDWLPPTPGYHLFYPSDRQPAPALKLLIDTLRFTAGLHETSC